MHLMCGLRGEYGWNAALQCLASCPHSVHVLLGEYFFNLPEVPAIGMV
jgi:hypothetical protein